MRIAAKVQLVCSFLLPIIIAASLQYTKQNTQQQKNFKKLRKCAELAQKAFLPSNDIMSPNYFLKTVRFSEKHRKKAHKKQNKKKCKRRSTPTITAFGFLRLTKLLSNCLP